MIPKPIVIKNRGYVRALQEIYKIMLNQELVKDYEEYLEVTDGDKTAAAVLALAGVRQEAVKAATPVTRLEPGGDLVTADNFEMRGAPQLPHGYTVSDPPHIP
jgi:hypothetical protein